MSSDVEEGGIIVVIVLLLIIVAVGPLLTIWSLNTLFNLAIPYTWSTWSAVVLLGGAVKGTTYSKSKD